MHPPGCTHSLSSQQPKLFLSPYIWVYVINYSTAKIDSIQNVWPLNARYIFTWHTAWANCTRRQEWVERSVAGLLQSTRRTCKRDCFCGVNSSSCPGGTWKCPLGPCAGSERVYSLPRTYLCSHPRCFQGMCHVVGVWRMNHGPPTPTNCRM